MGGMIYFLQLFECRVGIDFRRRHTLMAQQFSDALQPCPVVQHGGGEGVSQDVWRALLHRGDLRQAVLDRLLYHAAGDALSRVGSYQGCGLPPQLLVAPCHVFPQHLLYLVAHGDKTLLVALSRHLHLVLEEIDIAIVKPHQLGQSHPRAI